MTIFHNSINFNLNKKRKSSIEKVKKILKIFLYIFLIVSFLWGCVGMMADSVVSTQDIAGNSFLGTNFEIIPFNKQIFRIIEKKDLYYYAEKLKIPVKAGSNMVTNWKESFTKTHYSFFYGFFVYPVCLLTTSFILLFNSFKFDILQFKNNNYSSVFAMLFTIIIIKLYILFFTRKTISNQDKMSDIQSEVDVIKEKYKNNKDFVSKQKQQQEIMRIYKKHNTSPLASLGNNFLTLPVLFSLFVVIKCFALFKISTLGSINFFKKPYEEITKNQNYQYLLIIVVYVIIQLFSTFLPFLLKYKKYKLKNKVQKKSENKQLIIQVVMMCLFIYFVSTSKSALGIYWIILGYFQTYQTIGIDIYKSYKKYKHIQKKIKKKSKNK